MKGRIKWIVIILIAILVSACGATQPEPPVSGAYEPTKLDQRQGAATNPSYQTAGYTVYNDGKAAGWIMVSGVWNFDSNVPAGFLVKDNAWTVFDGRIFQNWKGDLFIWKCDKTVDPSCDG